MEHMKDMILWLVIFGAAALIIKLVFNKIEQFLYQVLGALHLVKQVADLTGEAEAPPRSLNACEGSVLPRILEDFPDFDLNLVKIYAREYIEQQLADKDGLVIHNVVLSQYLTASVQRAVVLQAAVSWMEDRKLQKRFDLTYTYKLSDSKTAVGANCPNCGATIGYGQRECPYCGSRVINALGQSWEFTELRET